MKKIYAYDNYEGDKGIIIADSLNEAVAIYKNEYPDRQIATTSEQYWEHGCYIYEINKVPPTCDDQPVCVIIDGAALVRDIYIIFMIVAILFDILAIVFSRLSFNKKLVVINLIVLSLEILLCVLLFIIK